MNQPAPGVATGREAHGGIVFLYFFEACPPPQLLRGGREENVMIPNVSEAGSGKIVLNHRNFFRACEWVKANKEIIEKERPTLHKLAEMVGTALSLKVSVGNARGLLKAVGMKITSSPTSPQCSRLLAALTQAVLDLYRDLGKPLPPALVDSHGLNGAAH